MEIYQILALIASILLIGAIIAIIVLKTRKSRTPIISEFPGLLNALGGISNIGDITCKGSRVSVIVNDKKIIDKDKVKSEGIETIVVSNKKVTMVVDNAKAILISSYLEGLKKELV
jgi:phosphotransferase system IIB component